MTRAMSARVRMRREFALPRSQMELHLNDSFIPQHRSRVVAKMIYRRCLEVFSTLAFAAIVVGSSAARDDGRYAGSPLKPWFDTLKSGKGLCCSFADGFAIADPDWESKDGHYRVRLEGEWIVVPDDAVITEPNRAGRTMVWPIINKFGTTIRCFMPGSMG